MTPTRQIERYQFWYNSGKKSKRRGLEKVSPFYENLTADFFFNCGFDGVKFEDATKMLNDKVKEILESDPTLVASVNEFVEPLSRLTK